VELIKNAYDADATRVVVHGERLGSHGFISVSDDGNGMTYADFVGKFLRIAGRSKEVGQRRSPRFSRKYTGAKGIGRLSAHKLGAGLELESSPRKVAMQEAGSKDGIRAQINWEAIEANTASIDAAREIVAVPVPSGATEEAAGTTLTISRLHSEWSARQLNDFLAEVRSTRADPALHEPLPAGVFTSREMVPSVRVSDTSEQDPGFQIELSGDFADTAAQWPTLLAHVNWLLEIDGRSADSVVYRITPAVRTTRVYRDAEVREFVAKRSSSGPRFVARIFIRDGSDSGTRLPDLLDTFARRAAGVRLFYEGFRVLPYGAPRNDWLGLDQASTRRESVGMVDDLFARGERAASDERTYQLSNSSYFGAVFLHDEGSGGLQMVVNREGFLPGPSFDELADAVRRGINLSVRLRASHGAVAREERERAKAAERRARMDALLRGETGTTNANASESRNERLSLWVKAGQEAASSLRSSITVTDEGVKRNVAIVQAALEELSSTTGQAMEEQAQLRVLASLGTQVGTFVHEVNGVLGQARVVADLLVQLANEVPASFRPTMREVGRVQGEMIAALERQALYLTDSIGAEARRRRARQPIKKRLSTALRLLQGAAQRRNVRIIDAVPDRLTSPPMFAAEVNVLLTNLLTNAIKAAAKGAHNDLSGGVVRVSGSVSDGLFSIRVENSGEAVALADAERWFRPFETTTTEIDATLGHGLGLGLPLTRRIVEEYGGTIQFVDPSAGMATAVDVRIPGR
jgi:signal transduction histidine kinase